MQIEFYILCLLRDRQLLWVAKFCLSAKQLQTQRFMWDAFQEARHRENGDFYTQDWQTVAFLSKYCSHLCSEKIKWIVDLWDVIWEKLCVLICKVLYKVPSNECKGGHWLHWAFIWLCNDLLREALSLIEAIGFPFFYTAVRKCSTSYFSVVWSKVKCLFFWQQLGRCFPFFNNFLVLWF